MSSQVLTPKLADMIGKSVLPAVQTEDLETKIKASDERLDMITKEADKASQSVDEQISKFQKQREELRKPFAESAGKVTQERAQISKELEERLVPLRKAIDELKTELIQKSSVILKQTVMTGVNADELKTKAQNIVTNLLTIDVPGVTGSPVARVSAPGTSARGRAGASKVMITKGAESHQLSSLNAARSLVYKQINGEEPKHQANGAACEKYLLNNGWKVEHLS